MGIEKFPFPQCDFRNFSCEKVCGMRKKWKNGLNREQQQHVNELNSH